MTRLFDVAIIGGGPAGLSAAASLVRQQYTTILFDSGSYRNHATSHMHTVPTWDHRDPKDFRAMARSQITSRYSTTEFANVELTKVERIESSFRLIDAQDNSWQARKLIIASGTTDIYPAIPGYEQCWAKRIFHCLYCHGYEERNDAPSSGVLAVDVCGKVGVAMHVAGMAARLTKAVNIYTNGNTGLAQELQGAGDVPPFSIVTGRIRRLVADENSVAVELEDGRVNKEAFLVHNPITHVKGPFAKQLGLELTPMRDIQTHGEMCQTSVSGVFAAGDCMTPIKAVPRAIASGNAAAVGAAMQLQAEQFGHKPMF